jgi:hypothetical protein
MGMTSRSISNDCSHKAGKNNECLKENIIINQVGMLIQYTLKLKVVDKKIQEEIARRYSLLNGNDKPTLKDYVVAEYNKIITETNEVKQ